MVLRAVFSRQIDVQNCVLRTSFAAFKVELVQFTHQLALNLDHVNKYHCNSSPIDTVITFRVGSHSENQLSIALQNTNYDCR